MSGGVDSSVAGHILKSQGYDVIGVTMKVWPQDCISRAEDKCCGPSAIADARGVAHTLGIPHYVVDEADQFEKLIIDYFSSEYQAGRTPNPCVMCNEKLKFGNLWTKARALGCDYIATGHYAIIEHYASREEFLEKARTGEHSRERVGTAFQAVRTGGPLETFPNSHARGRLGEASLPGYAVLRKGRDPRKDQSYFLSTLRNEQLLHALCPLGGMEKSEIRAIARQLGLKVADKADSQEICFVPGNDYKVFLKSHMEAGEFHPGGIYDKTGTRIAEHEGIEMFTIGQRKGLPGGSPRPRYVIDIDPATSSVIVGDEDDLTTEEFEIDRVNWIGEEEFAAPVEASVKIRYAHAGTAATVTPLENGRARVRLHEPQRAVTPGQAAVIYDGDRLLGGGWICRRPAVATA